MEKIINTLKNLILDNISDLTQSQKIIADYIIANPQKFALSSIREIEQELNISKTTIVRFTQRLGYKGFYELKTEFLKQIRNDLDPINRYKAFLNEPSTEQDFLESISRETYANIQSTLKLIDRDQYTRAIHLLKNADHVYTIGLGTSHFLAEIASYLFNRVSIKSDCMTNDGLTFVEKLINVGKKDVILTFAFPVYSEDTIQAAAYAHKKNIKVITITDKITSEIMPFTDAAIQVKTDSSTISNSMISVLLVLYAMVSQLGLELKNKTLQTIDSITYVRKAYKKHNK